ncbi:MAG: UvrD-helicase domain-containing protein [Dactylosporangium sp.]|nr:UvrD-helicase domain-containing protein [Dactylosporangium sp.]NNJ62602.1 UvrD-helicase domain-containing protein [Dactylosporangium sp.]
MPRCGVPPSRAAHPYVADLHIHSKYSRACAKDLELETLTRWARRKGITVLGTGDFTHPAWHDHLRGGLVPAEPGLFRIDPGRERDLLRRLPPRLASDIDTPPVRFMLSVEISTIYKRGDRTRKVHHVVYMPDFPAVERFNTALGRIGNLGADGRPILGLDSRDLLEITLEASEDGYLVPAHIWTPWFSALGSKSGFDSIADCYVDLADHIFAVETGLSSDPAMNWRVSSLDRYNLISNSDAHSAPALAREATLFSGDLDYFAIREAMRTGDGLAGTIEFFPEEGKYHADGHRACGVSWEPARTRAAEGRCPECGKPLTVGVLHRVEALADRPEGYTPSNAKPVLHLIQLAGIVGEIAGVGPRSKTVETQLNTLIAALGPELHILMHAPIDQIARIGGERLGEAITRLRAGRVHRTAGYDGEYGVIRLFQRAELRQDPQADTLFDVPIPQQRKAADPAPSRSAQPRGTGRRRSTERKQTPPPIAAATSPHEPLEPMLAGMEEVGTGLLDRLDALQRVAASAPGGPLLIVAGPGTGKTRTLTHRIAYLCAELGVYPEECLAITFTRRAAEELRERLDGLLGPVADDVTVTTFHALGLRLLRENATAAGLGEDFRIAEEAEQVAAIAAACGLPERTSPGQARRRLAELDESLRPAYVKALRANGLVDLDELVTLPVELLRTSPDLTDRYRRRWTWVFVDEYQDVDATQYELLRLLCPPGDNLCAIGDPDQSIYSFRGANVGFFLHFARDFETREVDARVVRLSRNYRSAAPIVAAAIQAIAPTTLVPGRRLDPARLDPDAPLIGHYPAGSVADEADFVVRTIDELVGGLTHRSHDSGRVDSRSTPERAVSFSDVAVLYRTDSQAAPIVDALARAGIPVQKRSHDRLLDRPGVAAIARELRFAADSQGEPLAARVRAAGRAVTARCTQPTLDQVGEGLLPADVHIAVDLLTPIAARHGNDLERFLTDLATGAEVDALDPRADRVALLTLHAAKGLEFPIVFLVGCEDGLLPLRLPGRVPTEEAIAEERRLFFVGVTRAQDRLFISHVRRRARHGTNRDVGPSPFLATIDAGLLERRGEDAPRRPKDRQLRLL